MLMGSKGRNGYPQEATADRSLDPGTLRVWLRVGGIPGRSSWLQGTGVGLQSGAEQQMQAGG